LELKENEAESNIRRDEGEGRNEGMRAEGKGMNEKKEPHSFLFLLHPSSLILHPSFLPHP